jgi:hypothetical protein
MLALIVTVALLSSVCTPYLHCNTSMHVRERTILKCTIEPMATPSMKSAAHRESRDVWQHRSSPQLEGGDQSRGTRDSVGILFYGEVGSGAVWHVAASEPSLTGRWVLESWDMWQRVVARSASYLGLKPICRGTRSAGYWQHLIRPCQISICLTSSVTLFCIIIKL